MRVGPASRSALSIIIPALDEERRIAACLAALDAPAAGAEVIVVDGGSRDATVARARAEEAALAARGLALRLLSAPRGRARQMNAGAAVSNGDALLFLHADTLLPGGAPAAVVEALARPGVVGGGFRHRFAEPGVALRLISAASNLRCRLFGTFYGDQAIFARREAFAALGGFRDLPIFEDSDLASRLRRAGRMVLLRREVRTSGRRYLGGGVARTVARIARMKLAYGLGREPGEVVGDYWSEPARGDRREG